MKLTHLQLERKTILWFHDIIGFSTNGEGKNKILNPKGKNSCPSGEATRARNFFARGVKNFIFAQAIGRESYSYELVIG